jgi:ATP-dependent DNA helicase RecQ
MSQLVLRLEQAANVLRARFSHRAFRPGQYRAVRAALAGRSALVVLPTGGGKSVCYQVPALVLEGLTVVVSPLISLMQDQVEAARRRGIAAASLTSTMSPREKERVMDELAGGRLSLLYVAPERLANGTLLGPLRKRGVALLAVDEAHCVSEWGHDFRPSYRRLGLVRAALGSPPTIALTATATRAVQDDIVRMLRLGDVERIVGSFDRPNLYLAAHFVKGEDERRRRIVLLMKPSPGPSIVYVSTRHAAERWARALLHLGVSAAPYHAGLEPSVRRGVQGQFIADQLECVVATSAFGMGIDKPNVRAVIHLGLSTSLEAYYQEAGRAGRDGRKARCHVIWSRGDVAMARKLVKDQSRLEPLLRYLCAFRCRRELMLAHFGEGMKRCAACDRCDRWIEFWRLKPRAA